jgi:hypothetical protein
MKVGIISILAALMLALPAFAGTDLCGDPSGLPDFDGDLVRDECDNCDAAANAGQEDPDGDGYGAACDGDFNQDGVVNGSDFLLFGTAFGIATVPPADPNADMNSDGVINGSDFLLFGTSFGNGLPGTSCGNALGTPCP